MTGNNNEVYADQWREGRIYEDDDSDEKPRDETYHSEFVDDETNDVSRKRRSIESSDHKTTSDVKSSQKSYYYEADDVSFDDVASDVTLIRWSEKLHDLPVAEKRGDCKRKWGEPPAPVTFYKSNKGPYSMI